MTFAAEAAAIESRFSTQWGVTTPIEWENIPYKPTPETSYVKFEIHNGESFQASLGDNYLQRSIGIISINVFTERGIGSREGRTLADSAGAIFRHWSSGGITCRMPKVAQVGEIGDWFVTNVSIPFYRDEQFS